MYLVPSDTHKGNIEYTQASLDYTPAIRSRERKLKWTYFTEWVGAFFFRVSVPCTFLDSQEEHRVHAAINNCPTEATKEDEKEIDA